MTDQEYAEMLAEERRMWGVESRWQAQGEALQVLAGLAYLEDDEDVGDALRERAEDLLSLVRD
jgi:hypothetical protein